MNNQVKDAISMFRFDFGQNKYFSYFLPQPLVAILLYLCISNPTCSTCHRLKNENVQIDMFTKGDVEIVTIFMSRAGQLTHETMAKTSQVRLDLAQLASDYRSSEFPIRFTEYL